MKNKILTLILIFSLILTPIFSLTGCAFIDDTLSLTELKLENENLKEENKQLRQLLFDLMYPNGIINQTIVLKNIERSVNGEGDAIQVIESATVTINGGKFDGGQTPLGGAGNTAIWCNSENAKIIINDGIFTIKGLAEGDVGHIDLIYCTSGTIEINGGYFEGTDDTVWLLNCKDSNYIEGKASIIVKGGEFVNFNPANCISEGQNTNFVAEGYTVTTTIIDETKTIYKVIKIDESNNLPEEEITPEF